MELDCKNQFFTVKCVFMLHLFSSLSYQHPGLRKSVCKPNKKRGYYSPDVF